MIKIILRILGILVIGALGAFIFEIFIFPYFLTAPYFADFQFVKNFKEGKIVLTQTRQIYINENTALEDSIKNAQKSIVAIQKNGVLSGAGLIATSDGYVITLSSLIPAGSKNAIFLNGEPASYQIIKRDFKNNLILAKIDKNNLETVGFADENKTMLGQRVFLTGPETVKGEKWFAGEGIIRSFDAGAVKTNIFEKYTASGAPLLNISGELVGLSYVGQDGKVSAVPASAIKSFLSL